MQSYPAHLVKTITLADGAAVTLRPIRIADAGNVLDQQMAARKQAGDGEPYLVFLAEDDLADLACYFF